MSEGEVKAIWLPGGRNDKISPPAFSFCTKFRHALVESGVKIVGEAVGRSCRQLQIVICQAQSSAHCMAPLAGAKLYEGRGPRLQAFRH